MEINTNNFLILKIKFIFLFVKTQPNFDWYFLSHSDSYFESFSPFLLFRFHSHFIAAAVPLMILVIIQVFCLIITLHYLWESNTRIVFYLFRNFRKLIVYESIVIQNYFLFQKIFINTPLSTFINFLNRFVIH